MAYRSTLTIRGWVATNPICRTTTAGRHVTTFRIADSLRRRDPETNTWSDSKTTWYTAQVWGDQALNVAESLRRSDAVVVTGHPWLEEWTKEDGEVMTRLVLDADIIAPDLSRGTARFARTIRDANGDASAAAGGAGSGSGSQPPTAVGDWSRGDDDETSDVEGADDDPAAAASEIDDDELAAVLVSAGDADAALVA